MFILTVGYMVKTELMRQSGVYIHRRLIVQDQEKQVVEANGKRYEKT
jgi:hypothetical protein